MTQERPPAGGAAANGSPEVPHPAIGVRDLRAERLELAARLTGPGADGVARRRRRSSTSSSRRLARAVGRSRPTGVDVAGIALGAVGSVGRGDAEPGRATSTCCWCTTGRGHSAEELAALAERLWYPIWDAGLDLDHSVRSLAQCRQVASKDLPGRRRAARPAARRRRRGRRRPRQVRAARRTGARPPAAGCPSCSPPPRQRAERHGELAYLIEPDLKEARGGHPRRRRALARSPPRGSPTARTARSTRAYAHLLDVRDTVQVVDAPAHQPAAARRPGRGRRARRLRRPRRPARRASPRPARIISYALDTTVRQRPPGAAAAGAAPPDARARSARARRGCARSARASSSTTARSCSPSRRARPRTRCCRCARPRPRPGPG